MGSSICTICCDIYSLHCHIQLRFNTDENILCRYVCNSAPWSTGSSKKTSQGGGRMGRVATLT